MNVDIENLEKRKKIVVICLSGALIFITLIAGLFIIKKNNKKDSYENNNLREVVNENNDNDKVNKKNNDEVIINEDKNSSRIIENIFLFIFTGISFFFWENDKLPKFKIWESISLKNKAKVGTLRILLCGIGIRDVIGVGIFEKANWFGLATLGSFIVITFLVELILSSSIIRKDIRKDKSKRYFHTFKMFWKKRMQFFSSSSSKIKIFFVVFSYLLYGFVIAMLARRFDRCNVCCRKNKKGIIDNHGSTCCFGFGEFKNREEELEYERERIPDADNTNF